MAAIIFPELLMVGKSIARTITGSDPSIGSLRRAHAQLRELVPPSLLHQPAALDHSPRQLYGAGRLITAGMIKAITALDQKAVDACEP